MHQANGRAHEKSTECTGPFVSKLTPTEGIDRRLKRHIPQNRRAVHHAALRSVVVHRVMLGHSVVPHRHVVFLPTPADGELGSRRFIDPGGETLIHEQRFAPADRVRADHRMGQRRVFAAGFFPARQVLGGVAEALQRERAGEVMGGRQPVEQCLHRSG
nr:hypothetical protein [Tanacetum cinerariifolium]